MQFKGITRFDPDRDIPSLRGKVIFISGGTAGLGAQCVKALAKHLPEQIYFTGRNTCAGDKLIQEVKVDNPAVSLKFIKLDMNSLLSVKQAIQESFMHDRLDIVICNAGIMASPPELSQDGFEIQFAVNHLAHAMLIRELTPVMSKTAEKPNADVRLVLLTSLGWKVHPKEGVAFDQLRTTQEAFTAGSWIRYGQSKLANIVYAAEFARRYPSITAVSVHPGVVATDLVNNLGVIKRGFVYATSWMQGIKLLSPEQGAFNQLWAAAGAQKSELINGALYTPIGVESNDTLDNVAKNADFAQRLWQWTEDTLAGY